MQQLPSTSTLVFHVGDPKTGTSSIQRALAQQLGSHISQSYVSWREHNATSVAAALQGKDPIAREKKFLELRKWLEENKADNAVVSSEFLAEIAPLELRQAVDEYLPNYAQNCRIIAYARPHASRFLAAYIQRVKTGIFSGTPSDFLTIFEKSRMHQYSYRFGRWRRNFGQNFILRPFGMGRIRNDDIVDDFFRRLFRDANYTIENTVVENTSLTLASLVGFRIVQNELVAIGVGSHLRSVVGGTLANRYLPARQKKGVKLAMERDILLRIKSISYEDATITDKKFFKVPFMVPELEKAIDSSIVEAMVLEPTAHFEVQRISEIKELSRKLALQLKESSRAWSLNARVQRGLALPSEGEIRMLESSYHKIVKIDNDLAAISDLITGSS